MSGESEYRVDGQWGNRRGLSTITAVVVMIVVILVVGGVSFAAFNGNKGTTGGTHVSTVTKCWPPTAPICGFITPTHDVALLVPFHVAQVGTPIPFTATLHPGEIATGYTFNFGDGVTAASTTGTATHSYANAGSFLVSVQATVSGSVHDNLHALVAVSITSSFASLNSANAPVDAGVITANTTSTSLPTSLVQAGGFIQVQGSYAGAPTNPVYVAQTPTITTSSANAAISGLTTTASSAGAKVTFGTAGIYTVTFVGSAANGVAIAYQNYTWTAYVVPAGVNAGLQSTGATAVSPHKGQLIIYEEVPGGASTLDPAIAYDTASAEPIENVYQPLIAYNASQTGPTPTNFLPILATCVPGSAQCSSLYGNSLVSGWNFTFVVSSAPQFYDPNTGAHWGVYPTDVVFSMARTLGFSTQPGWQAHNGWIIAQSLLPAGNPGWDAGIHNPANNTPWWTLNSMSINDSLCSSLAGAMTTDHGCVTFHAYGFNHTWPYFLELIGDYLGGSIVSCGWVSSTAGANSGQAGIPYWTAGNVSGAGDHPCGLPGSPGYGVAPAAIPRTGWDAWQTGGAVNPSGIGNPITQMVGTGPYYLKNYQVSASYTLAASPNYVTNPNCAVAGCYPAPGKYAGSVSVVWEGTATPGEQAYAAGTADFASIPSTDTALLLQLIQQGKVGAYTFPSISIDFFPYDLNYSYSGGLWGGITHLTVNPVTIPTDFFTYVGMRMFFNTAFPYATIQSTINTKDGINYAFLYGGVIPKFMANYYPTNISWPSADPCTDSSNAACPAYWWAQMTTSGSPYYDPEAVACTTSSPCQLPIFGETGAPDLDQRIQLWINELNTLSGGKLKISTLDLNFLDLVIYSLFSPPGNNPMALYRLGWAPDYPDPTDYLGPMWGANSTYGFGDALYQQLVKFNGSSCHPAGLAALGYYSSHVVNQTCEGAAYVSMLEGMNFAATLSPGAQRVLIYNMVENIGAKLALYQYDFQANYVYSFASWIDGTTLNANITIGGGGDQTWWSIGGNGVY